MLPVEVNHLKHTALAVTHGSGNITWWLFYFSVRRNASQLMDRLIYLIDGYSLKKNLLEAIKDLGLD